MSRFNSTVPKQKTLTVNHAGGEAYQESDKLELVSILLTSMLKDEYYRSGDDTLKRLVEIIHNMKDKKFAAKAAVYGRNVYGLRSVSHVVAAEIAHEVKGEGHLANKMNKRMWTQDFYEKVVFRADDITEILSYYFGQYGKPLPNSLRRGLKKALSKFDEYQIAKYRGENHDLKMVDAVNLLHPVGSTKNAVALEKLINGTLKNTRTWESKLSEAGKAKDEKEKADLKKETWEELLKTKKMPYMALVKNLRNIIQQSPAIIPLAMELLTDEDAIKKSKLFPFRFMSAIQEIGEIHGSEAQKVLVGLNKALEISLANVPRFDGRTLVVIDHSGSMDSVSHGNISNFNLGALFGLVLARTNDADVMCFGDTAKYYPHNPTDSIITNIKNWDAMNGGYGYGNQLGKFEVGHGTNFHSIFHMMNKPYDRIIIFSDMQGWMGYDTPVKDLKAYEKTYNVNPYIYSVDLTGYGTLQFPESRVCALAGYSDKMFDIMKVVEQDRNALVNAIEAIEL